MTFGGSARGKVTLTVMKKGQTNVKVKVKLPLFLTKYQNMKTYGHMMGDSGQLHATAALPSVTVG
jgi:hypothetical protein